MEASDHLGSGKREWAEGSHGRWDLGSYSSWSPPPSGSRSYPGQLGCTWGQGRRPPRPLILCLQSLFSVFKNQPNCLPSKPAVPRHPLAVPCCPRSSCRKLHKRPSLRPALGPGQPVSQVGAGSPRGHPLICLAVGSAPGLRVEIQGRRGTARLLWSGFPAPPTPLVTCGFD